MTPLEIEAYLILKYGSVEKGMIVWLSSTEVHPEENKLLSQYAKHYWPNLNLTHLRHPPKSDKIDD